ncbi:hypothetical protein PaG_05085 [Moesziomyces aphidis]|uniref:Uncharacterized protein n=1 Tax=Moesziomyces aphidis TaxID=84754 RepID=W3VHT4_MOEAP|nr:hypothetical protein PaG_05085 [Moesziomyces aphidis]
MLCEQQRGSGSNTLGNGGDRVGSIDGKSIWLGAVAYRTRGSRAAENFVFASRQATPNRNSPGFIDLLLPERRASVDAYTAPQVQSQSGPGEIRDRLETAGVRSSVGGIRFAFGRRTPSKSDTEKRPGRVHDAAQIRPPLRIGQCVLLLDEAATAARGRRAVPQPALSSQHADSAVAILRRLNSLP